MLQKIGRPLDETQKEFFRYPKNEDQNFIIFSLQKKGPSFIFAYDILKLLQRNALVSICFFCVQNENEPVFFVQFQKRMRKQTGSSTPPLVSTDISE